MIKLQENQKHLILVHKNRYYACVADIDENGALKLKSYHEIPCVEKDETGATVNFEQLNTILKSTVFFDIDKEADKINNSYNYIEFVRNIIKQQCNLYNLECIRDVCKQYLNAKDLEGKLTHNINILRDKFEEDEYRFANEIVPNFLEEILNNECCKSYKADKMIYSVANGNTTLSCEDAGINLDTIEYNCYGDLYDEFIDAYRNLKAQVEEYNKKIISETIQNTDKPEYVM